MGAAAVATPPAGGDARATLLTAKMEVGVLLAPPPPSNRILLVVVSSVVNVSRNVKMDRLSTPFRRVVLLLEDSSMYIFLFVLLFMWRGKRKGAPLKVESSMNKNVFLILWRFIMKLVELSSCKCLPFVTMCFARIWDIQMTLEPLVLRVVRLGLVDC